MFSLISCSQERKQSLRIVVFGRKFCLRKGWKAIRLDINLSLHPYFHQHPSPSEGKGLDSYIFVTRWASPSKPRWRRHWLDVSSRKEKEKAQKVETRLNFPDCFPDEKERKIAPLEFRSGCFLGNCISFTQGEKKLGRILFCRLFGSRPCSKFPPKPKANCGTTWKRERRGFIRGFRAGFIAPFYGSYSLLKT